MYTFSMMQCQRHLGASGPDIKENLLNNDFWTWSIQNLNLSLTDFVYVVCVTEL